MRQRLNDLGTKRTPLLFILPFERPFEDGLVYPLDRLPPDISLQIDAYQLGPQPDKKGQKPPSLGPLPKSFVAYKRAFDALKKEIYEGNCYLANLCARTPLDTQAELGDLYAWSQSRYKLMIANRFVCFSPEPFVTIGSRRIATFPMKGTLPVDQNPQMLLEDTKERAEHTMVVDLLRNDLGRVGRNVRVRRWRYLERVGNLWQSSSEIVAHLPSNWPDRLGDLLGDLLPAGSISGTPKRSTVEILQRIEGFDRGFFSGVFGLFDGRHLTSAVMIRFVERQAGGLVFKSGGGITSDSDAQKEYQELCAKATLPLGPKNEPIGVFETLCVQDGQVRHQPWHQRRLNAAQKRQGQRPIWPMAHERPALPTKGRFRLRLIDQGEGIRAQIATASVSKPHRLRIVHANLHYGLKRCDRRAFEPLYKSRQNADDVLIVRRGLITDTTVANIAFFDGDRWLTPAAALLKGTVRARLVSGGFLRPATLRLENLDQKWLVGLMNAITGFYIAGTVKDVLINDQ